MNDSFLQDILNNFHFLRPEWFYALIPGLLLFLLLRYRQSQHSNWENAIAPHLLEHIRRLSSEIDFVVEGSGECLYRTLFLFEPLYPCSLREFMVPPVFQSIFHK